MIKDINSWPYWIQTALAWLTVSWMEYAEETTMEKVGIRVVMAFLLGVVVIKLHMMFRCKRCSAMMLGPLRRTARKVRGSR